MGIRGWLSLLGCIVAFSLFEDRQPTPSRQRKTGTLGTEEGVVTCRMNEHADYEAVTFCIRGLYGFTEEEALREMDWHRYICTGTCIWGEVLSHMIYDEGYGNTHTQWGTRLSIWTYFGDPCMRTTLILWDPR